MKVDLAPRAVDDLEEIWVYVAEQSGLRAADRSVDAVRSRIQSLEAHPELGRSRDELLLGLRCVVERPWLVFYRLTGERVEVIRILHGRRDLPSLF